MFAVSFVACGKKNDPARQPEDVKNDEESAGHPQDANSESSSDSTSSLSIPSSDNSLDTLKDGDKVTVVSCTDDIGPNKCTIVLKFERDKSSTVINKEVAIAPNLNSHELTKVLTEVAETNDGGKIYIAMGTKDTNKKGLFFYVFYSTDTLSCVDGMSSPNYMGARSIEDWKSKSCWILKKEVDVPVKVKVKGKDKEIVVRRKYSLVEGEK
jgi:hypothetical protein